MPFPTHAVIITAAGSSARFNQGDDIAIKKEFLELNGHSVLFNATKCFLTLPNLQGIFVTYRKDMETQTLLALEEIALQNKIPVYLIEGGDTRQKSVFLALQDVKEKCPDVEFVSIHDGARPFITQEQIIITIATAKVTGGAVGAQRMTDTIASISSNDLIESYIPRDTIVGIQTPQTFRFCDILAAHEKAVKDKVAFTDDTQIFRHWGGKILLCDGKLSNRKITNLGDL